MINGCSLCGKVGERETSWRREVNDGELGPCPKSLPPKTQPSDYHCCDGISLYITLDTCQNSVHLGVQNLWTLLQFVLQVVLEVHTGNLV